MTRQPICLSTIKSFLSFKLNDICSLRKLGVAFNEVAFDEAGLPTIDRTSRMGFYDLAHGLPMFASAICVHCRLNSMSRNPNGRTGYSGRGLLLLWGPNHAIDAVLTR